MALADSTGWPLLGHIWIAKSLTELSDISAQQLIDVLKLASHGQIPLAVPSRQSTELVSRSNRLDGQLQILLGAAMNVLQLYAGSDSLETSLRYAARIELLLLQLSAVLATAIECTSTVQPDQHLQI